MVLQLSRLSGSRSGLNLVASCPLVQMSKKGLIYELEVFAAVQGALDLLAGKSNIDVVLFTDNEAALSCLISGRAEGVAACILQRLVSFEEDSGVNFWFEWVPSQSNPADAPSRRECSSLDSSLTSLTP